MTKDLIQAYSNVLMSDEELGTYQWNRNIITTLSMGLAGIVPFAFIVVIRPEVMENLGREQRAGKFWLAGAISAFSMVAATYKQHKFLDTIGHKYFGELSDEQVRTYRALYSTHLQ